MLVAVTQSVVHCHPCAAVPHLLLLWSARACCYLTRTLVLCPNTRQLYNRQRLRMLPCLVASGSMVVPVDPVVGFALVVWDVSYTSMASCRCVMQDNDCFTILKHFDDRIPLTSPWTLIGGFWSKRQCSTLSIISGTRRWVSWCRAWLASLISI